MRRPEGVRAPARAAPAVPAVIAALLAVAAPVAAAWDEGAAPALTGSAPTAPATAGPATVLGWPDGGAPRAPQNFRVTVYARGLAGPRSLLVLPNGDVLVTEVRPAEARITLLRDGRGDGVADQQFVLLAGLKQPFGLALRRDRLYVATADAVLSCPYLVGQTRMHGECRKLLELPAGGSGEHAANGIAFSPDEARLYVGVGAVASAGAGAGTGTGAGHGAILVARPDGRELRVFASGPANPAGLAFEPHSSVLFATLNGSERSREGGAPDCLASVRDGGSFGGSTGTTDSSCEASATALGLAFYGREHFPKQYRDGAFVTQHGARRGAELAGYKVVFVPFAAGKPAGAGADFLTGFVHDAARGEVYGRPAGVAVATDGTLLVADDAGSTIWRVTFKCAACTPDPPRAAPRLPHLPTH